MLLHHFTSEFLLYGRWNDIKISWQTGVAAERSKYT